MSLKESIDHRIRLDLFILFILIGMTLSCKNKAFKTTITGHVFNMAENTNYTDGEIILQEFDNGIEGNSKTVGTAYTDSQGNFSITFDCIKRRSYSVFTEGGNLMISGSKGYKTLQESKDFRGNEIPSSIELTCATKASYSVRIIHDLGSDSMCLETSHLYLDTYAKGWYYGDEHFYPSSYTGSGKRYFKWIKYKNGAVNIQLDTLYFPPAELTEIEVHY
jgi:hypothetical protein